jgi:hypothetical protein
MLLLCTLLAIIFVWNKLLAKQCVCINKIVWLEQTEPQQD